MKNQYYKKRVVSDVTEIESFIDQWNKNKIWLVKRTKCGHYYLAQKVNGVLIKGFERVRFDWIMKSVFGV